MPNTYTCCYIQQVFAVKNRDALITKEIKVKMEKYITGIVQNHRHKLIAICAMPDHLHILIGYNTSQSILELVENIKTSSNGWIKHNRLSRFRFEWQKGYGAFSYSKSDVDKIYKYIMNQELHHGKTSFRDENITFLHNHSIDYNEKYLFDFL